MPFAFADGRRRSRCLRELGDKRGCGLSETTANKRQFFLRSVGLLRPHDTREEQRGQCIMRTMMRTMNNRGEEEEKRRDEDESLIRHAGSRYISGPGWRRRQRKSHTFRRTKREAGSEGRPVCEEAISPSSVGDSNPLLVWDLGGSDCLTTGSACVPACPPAPAPGRSIDRRRGCVCRLCVLCLPRCRVFGTMFAGRH